MDHLLKYRWRDKHRCMVMCNCPPQELAEQPDNSFSRFIFLPNIYEIYWPAARGLQKPEKLHTHFPSFGTLSFRHELPKCGRSRFSLFGKTGVSNIISFFFHQLSFLFWLFLLFLEFMESWNGFDFKIIKHISKWETGLYQSTSVCTHAEPVKTVSFGQC